MVYTKQLQDGSRKIMEIIEGEDYLDGKLITRSLYRFNVLDNMPDEGGTIRVMGSHTKMQEVSEVLHKRFLDLYADNGRRKERVGDMVVRLGLRTVLELMELEPDPAILSEPTDKMFIVWPTLTGWS